MTTYPCEVLIVGGGILGAWVLDALLTADQPYQSPILLETELLGCRQTGHSDAFLHQGYAYYRNLGAAVLIDGWDAWKPWLPPPVPPATLPHAYHVFFDPADRQTLITWRQGSGLPPVPPQHNLFAQCPVVSTPNYSIETDEQCAPGDWIVDRLVDGRRSHLQKVRRIIRIVLAQDNRLGKLRVQTVEVEMNDRSIAAFEPQTLLLCAGRANPTLLDPNNFVVSTGQPLPEKITDNKPLNGDAKLDMVVIRGPSNVLPVFNGSITKLVQDDATGQLWTVFAFVVSREDLGGNRVWIASGKVYQTDPQTGKEVSVQGSSRFFRRMLIKLLSNVVPFTPADPQLVWGVYQAILTTLLPKSRPLSSQTFESRGVEGLLVCYTDRLTITPLAAAAIEQEVSLKLRPNWPTQSIAMPVLPVQPVALHPEYWRTPARWEQQTSWPWPAFQVNCL